MGVPCSMYGTDAKNKHNFSRETSEMEDLY
jgi:hypothetical protein